ncbi:MAG: manganese efflux pump [Clostridia bacterium]|nr:manganese efflux pump [Clostridia bacterium]
MEWSLLFFVNSALLGIGLAMDAFSVSLANGLNDTEMKTRKMLGIAAVFAVFQYAMPMIGWVCVHTVMQYFTAFEKVVPLIALVLLSYIGGKMLFEGIKQDKGSEACSGPLCLTTLLVQGVATSIDALSVGFTIADHDFIHALACCLIIGAVTFFICLGGLIIGKSFGNHLAGRAGILGGVILIAIGIEIFLTGILG